MRSGFAVLAALLGSLTGCKSLFAYQCTASTECTSNGTPGTCESNGFCSFPDPACASGRRYGEWAGSLGESCVGDDADIDAPPGFDAPRDAPPNAITRSFGETGTADVANVTIDTEIALGSTDNAGDGDHNSVDDDELALFRFDISSIPTGATVASARIEVSTTHEVAPQIFSSGSASVYQLLQTWDELTVTSFERSAGVGWTNPGAGPPTSRNPTPIAQFAPTSEGRYSLDMPVAMVQGWISNPSSNAGIIIEVADGVGHLHLGTREGAAANRALMFVTYVP